MILRGLTIVLLLASLPVLAAAEENRVEPVSIFFANANEAMGNLVTGLEGAADARRRFESDARVQDIRSRVSDIDGRLANAVGRKEYLISSLTEYLDRPSPDGWRDVVDQMQAVAQIMDGILSEINVSSSDLVRITGPDLVSNLVGVLYARQGIMTRMQQLPEPQTDAELASLRRLVGRYDELVSKLRRLNSAIDRYIAQAQPR